MNTRLKGSLFGIVSAVSYAINPLGALFLYEDGVNTHSVLFYRFSLAALILGGFLLAYKKSFRITYKEWLILLILGMLFAASSLTLFASLHYMSVGVACTLLFVYPIIVAGIMTLFFKERLTLFTIASILLALPGIWLLNEGSDTDALSALGVTLVMISASTYALYMIVVNKAPLRMPAVKLTFYVLVFCVLTIVAHAMASSDTHIQLLTTPTTWMLAIMLALIPTVISLITMVYAVHMIGSTPTAILGALEPVAAVAIGVFVFGETLSLQLAFGILLILASVMLIIAGRSGNQSGH
jgi:drug/metabolite transporter (DMT)-like permease